MEYSIILSAAARVSMFVSVYRSQICDPDPSFIIHEQRLLHEVERSRFVGQPLGRCSRWLVQPLVGAASGVRRSWYQAQLVSLAAGEQFNWSRRVEQGFLFNISWRESAKAQNVATASVTFLASGRLRQPEIA